MFTCAITLLLLFLVIFLTALLENHYSPDELANMGIRLENSHS